MRERMKTFDCGASAAVTLLFLAIETAAASEVQSSDSLSDSWSSSSSNSSSSTEGDAEEVKPWEKYGGFLVYFFVVVYVCLGFELLVSL